MKTLKDITPEQAIQIAKMIFDYSDFIKSDMEFKYFDGNYGTYVTPDDAEITVRFDFDAFPENRIGKMIVHIFPNLDCSIAEYDLQQNFWKHKHSYPVRNQNAVQKKFIEWGIEPVKFGTNTHVTKNAE